MSSLVEFMGHTDRQLSKKDISRRALLQPIGGEKKNEKKNK